MICKLGGLGLGSEFEEVKHRTEMKGKNSKAGLGSTWVEMPITITDL
jgi:hypothetical protein